MVKTLLFMILVYAGYRFFVNMKSFQLTKQNKKKKADYKNMDIQDADYTDLKDE